MKKLFRYLLIALAIGTTGLFAQAATETPAPTTQSPQKTVKKTAKKGKKGKGHKKHKKKKSQ